MSCLLTASIMQGWRLLLQDQGGACLLLEGGSTRVACSTPRQLPPPLPPLLLSLSLSLCRCCQVTPRTPTWRAAAGASTYDDSWLYDTNMDNFYEQEVIDTVIAQGAHAMNAMNTDMNMDAMNMDWQPSPVWQQQWQALSAGMNRGLLAPAAAAAGGGGATAGQQQQRPRMPSRMSRAPPPGLDAGPVGNAAAAAGGAPIPSPAYTVTPPDEAADPGSGQQQQQPQGDAMEEDARVAAGGQSAAAGGIGQPAQPVQQVDEQQLVGLSPLQRLLRGGRPLWPLMPTAEGVLDMLRTKGLQGLVVYLEKGSFQDYVDNTKVRRFLFGLGARGTG